MTYVILLIVFFVPQTLTQTERAKEANAAPEIEIRKFSWARQREAPNPSWDRTVVTSGPINRSKPIESRSRDLRVLEGSVSRDRGSGKSADLYRYKIELRNSGARVIKLVFFDYQTSLRSDPDNPSHREFVCAVKIKPNETRSFVAESVLPPSRVVEAATKGTTLNETLVINRIEYAEGSVWQRSNWNAPDNVSDKPAGSGPCRAI